jgi:hypothetical protein
MNDFIGTGQPDTWGHASAKRMAWDGQTREYFAHFLEERPYQSFGDVSIRRRPPVPEIGVVPLREIRCRQRLF